MNLEETEEKTPEWLISGYIPKRKITVLAGDGGAGNGGAGATGQSNAIMGKNGTRGGGGGGGGAGWTFRSSEYKPSGIGGKGGDGYVAIYARGIS